MHHSFIPGQALSNQSPVSYAGRSQFISISIKIALHLRECTRGCAELASGRGKRRRNRYDIWALILDLLIEEERTLNGIRDATRLNQERLKHHLDDLVALGLAWVDRSRRFTTYSITDHGAKWRESYKGIATESSGKEDLGTDF